MRIFLIILVILGVAFFALTQPQNKLPFDIPEGDASLGEYTAIAGGCASCHGADFAGGEALYSPFGTFYAPNITPANYTATKDEFARAILNGVGVNGKHLYPAFPYTTYQHMTPQDVADLYAYIVSLPAVEKANTPNELVFFARWRRPLGIWKKLREHPPLSIDRGGYLVEVLGHCQECHTPRTLWGTLRYAKSFEGGAVYDKNRKRIGTTPNLRTGDSASWSTSEIASYLTDGFTPEFDSAGGAMVEVIENTSRLSEDDRDAIAQYIESLHQ